MKIKAAVARQHGMPLSIEGLDLDEPREDEIVVRLVATGVSRADLDAIDGILPMPMPFVPGREGAGVVERVGEDVSHVAPGDAVILTYASCGFCPNCAAGRPSACADFGALNLAGRRLDGSTAFSDDVGSHFFGQSSFATHTICRAANAIKVPPGAPLEIVASLGGEPLAGAGTILHGFRVRRGDSVVVSGADAVGLLAIIVAKARGAGPIVVADPDESRRALASELGATVAIHTGESLGDTVRSLTGEGARFALETTGDDEARRACLDSLATSGVCAFVNRPNETSQDAEDQATADRPTILAADGHAPPTVLVPELLRLQAAGHLPIDDLIDFFPFERVNDALDALRAQRVVQPVLRFPLGAFADLDRAKAQGAASDVPEDRPSDETDKTPEPVISELNP